MKCKNCDRKRISRILFHDRVVDYCPDCECVKIPLCEYEHELLTNCIFDLNAFGTRSGTVDYDSIDEFKKEMSLSNFSFNGIREDELCNLCGECLADMKNRSCGNYRILVCGFCNSVYILREEFDDAAKEVVSRINRKKKSIWRRILNWIKSHVKK